MACKGETMDDSLMNSMECSICTEVFTEPKQLLCGHTLCALCVVRLVDEAKTRVGLGGGAGGRGRNQHAAPVMIDCPECRQPTAVPPKGLPTNYKVADLVRRLQAQAIDGKTKEQVKFCDICKGKVAADKLWHCVSCSVYKSQEENKMCSDCGVEKHNGHQLLKISTHLIERKQKTVDKLRECRAAATEHVTEIHCKNLKIQDLCNDLYETMNVLGRQPYEFVISDIEATDVVAERRLKQAEEQGSTLAMHAQAVAERIASVQDRTINEFQVTASYAKSGLKISPSDSVARADNAESIDTASGASNNIGSYTNNAGVDFLGTVSNSAAATTTTTGSVNEWEEFSPVILYDRQVINLSDSNTTPDVIDGNFYPTSSVYSALEDENCQYDRPLSDRVRNRRNKLEKRAKKSMKRP